MSAEKWAVAIAFITLIGSGLVGWVSLESRVSALESQMADVIVSRDILSKEMISLIKHVGRLEGQHEGHEGLGDGSSD